MSKTVINTEKAPAAVGPYIQGSKVGSLVFTSGQLGMDPKTGEFVGSDVASQAHQAMKNLGEVLKAGGSDYKKVIRSLIFLTDMNDFAVVNEIYQSYFDEEFPARSCVEVSKLPKGGLVEIECIAEV